MAPRKDYEHSVACESRASATVHYHPRYDLLRLAMRVHLRNPPEGPETDWRLVTDLTVDEARELGQALMDAAAVAEESRAAST